MTASDIEQRVTMRVAWQFIPFLVLCYFVAYLDRVNVGFAKLTMDADIGITDTVFGFGAGVFFLAYFLFEVPSNLLLDRFGARRWIARIMFTWGLVSGAMAFIPQISQATGFSGEYTFYTLRVLLGFAEAGFFPGIIFYLTLWFPVEPPRPRRRLLHGRGAAVVGGGVAGLRALLGLNGVAGLAGWQWLFVAEAAPSLIVAVIVFFYLTDRPADARWLPDDERAWLVQRLAAEEKVRAVVSPASVLKSLYDGRVLAASLVYFGIVACLYGVGFWMPSIVKGFGVSIAATGWINAIPYVLGVFMMIWWVRRSDAHMERVGHLAAALAAMAIGIGAAAALDDPLIKMIALTIGGLGVFAALPVFWTVPTAILSGATAAAGIAAINSLGNLAGYVGPFIVGWIKDATGSFAWGLAAIAALAAIALVTALILGHDPALEKAPEEACDPVTASL